MNKTLKLIALTLLAGVGFAAAADDAAGRKDKPAKRKGPMTADANSDRKVSLEELTAWGAARQPKPMKDKAVQAMFTRRDANKDGFLTADELKGGRKKKDPAPGEAKPKKPKKEKKDAAPGEAKPNKPKKEKKDAE